MLLSEITKGLPGTLLRDGTFSRLDYCTVKENGPFLSFMEREKFLNTLIENESVSCILCTPNLIKKIPDRIRGIFVTEEPKAIFETIHNRLSESSEYCLQEFTTKIGRNCSISPLAYISPQNVCIGDNVIIDPFVFIGEHVEIGNNCKIYCHATVGGRSFSYARIGDNEITGLIDCGKVVLDEGVEIMSYTHLARGILPTDVTYIGKKSVIDAHCHIGHGTRLQERVFVAANASIGGNALIGKDSWIGLSATVSNRIIVGSKCRVSIGAVVTKNVPDDMVVTGNFAVEHGRFIEELRIQNRKYNASEVKEK